MTQSFEDQMLHFISENKRILNLHEKKFSDLDNFQANTVMFQTNTNASLKNLEVQIGQLAQVMQKKPKDCMAVILRSGRDLDERRSEKKDIEEEKQAEIGEEPEQYSSGTTKKKKQHKCSPISKERRKKLSLAILQSYSLRDCRKQS